jgi:hypothetical protein
MRDDSEFRELRRLLRSRVRGQGHKLAPELAARAAEWTRLALASGVGVKAIARAFDVAPETVRRWRAARTVDGPASLVRVEVVDEVPARTAHARTFSVVAASGLRVDGLYLDEVATLLRALRWSSGRVEPCACTRTRRRSTCARATTASTGSCRADSAGRCSTASCSSRQPTPRRVQGAGLGRHGTVHLPEAPRARAVCRAVARRWHRGTADVERAGALHRGLRTGGTAGAVAGADRAQAACFGRRSVI